MPLVTISLRQGTTPDYRRRVSEALHTSMVDVLKIPEDDQFHVFHEVPDDDFVIQPVVFGLPRGRGTLFIQLSFNRRGAEQKAELFRAIVDNLRRHAGVPEEDVLLVAFETAAENWWAAGRVVDPATGYDERMTDVPAGPAR
ncbi:tautomerase family protein [Streptomyces sp. CCM_MD2014]|uniref:tautomerase family protein n=1 Tax=Streptomyces sp. CCM_MD2014 TaxID=1561022 RepID=UPI00052A6CFA|nr:tautomerase family protein [Streptomyces sp. CCM_MD2014]AIV37939.1 4-oxalocrotonate tautomerase [Streptomyces sp. CCM_MD2014]